MLRDMPGVFWRRIVCWAFQFAYCGVIRQLSLRLLFYPNRNPNSSHTSALRSTVHCSKVNTNAGFSPSVAPFSLLSFQLHAHLASAHNGRQNWGYTPSTGLSYNENGEEAVGGSGEDFLANGTSRAQAAAAAILRDEKEVTGPVWLKSGEGVSWEVISQDTSTAQM